MISSLMPALLQQCTLKKKRQSNKLVHQRHQLMLCEDNTDLCRVNVYNAHDKHWLTLNDCLKVSSWRNLIKKYCKIHTHFPQPKNNKYLIAIFL